MTAKRNAPISFPPNSLFDDDDKLEEAGGSWFRKDLAPGAAQWCGWYDRPDVIAGLHFVCPCGCGNVGYLSVSGAGRPIWQWDGNKDQPTLQPSIQKLSSCRWHGHLRAGVFEEC